MQESVVTVLNQEIDVLTQDEKGQTLSLGVQINVLSYALKDNQAISQLKLWKTYLHEMLMQTGDNEAKKARVQEYIQATQSLLREPKKGDNLFEASNTFQNKVIDDLIRRSAGDEIAKIGLVIALSVLLVSLAITLLMVLAFTSPVLLSIILTVASVATMASFTYQLLSTQDHNEKKVLAQNEPGFFQSSFEKFGLFKNEEYLKEAKEVLKVAQTQKSQLLSLSP